MGIIVRSSSFRIVAILIVVLALSNCEKKQAATSEFVLGTVCTVNLFEQGTNSLYQSIFKRLREIDDRMSANKDGTEIDSINRNAGIGPIAVHDDLIYVTKTALKYAELSKGYFDPTIGAVIKLWDIGGSSPRIPQAQELESALRTIGWKDLVVDENARTIFLKRQGMRMDLGAIAKGYAADEVVRILRENHIDRAIIDLGGNIYAFGEKPDNSFWKIGIQDPSGIRGEYIGIVSIKNRTLVTSGVYERFFQVEGTRYHHIISTKDGYPVNNGLESVTIIAQNSIDADALSTSCFALGYEAGRALVESIDDTHAIFVFIDGSIRITKGLPDMFSISSERYTIVE